MSQAFMQMRFPFGGETYEPERDEARLGRSLAAVRQVMQDHQWHTIAELAEKAECSQAAASARIRDLRKPQFGSYTIEREYMANGLWRYRMVLS